MRVLIAFVLLAAVYGKPSNYIVNEQNGIGYRLVYQAQPWERASLVCAEEGAKLAVPKSQEEFTFLQRLVRGMQYHDVVGSRYRLLVWLGINNLRDYTVWTNVDGEDIRDTGYHTWTGQYNGDTYSNDPSEPHCAGMDAANPYKDVGLLGMRHECSLFTSLYYCSLLMYYV